MKHVDQHTNAVSFSLKLATSPISHVQTRLCEFSIETSFQHLKRLFESASVFYLFYVVLEAIRLTISQNREYQNPNY